MLMRSSFFTAILLFVLVPVHGRCEDLERNRHKLEQLRAQPEALARLRQKARAFLSLPPEQAKRLLDLDEGLQKLPVSERHRLERTLERYVDWLERLSPKDQQRIKEAPDNKSRLVIIRNLREDEWLERQPAAFRDGLVKLTLEQRGLAIKARKARERREQLEWRIAARFWSELTREKRALPYHLTDFPPEVQAFVKHYLLPRLSARETAELHNAEGHWPAYPMTLVALADRHPPALPYARGPKKAEDLPDEVLRRLFKAKPERLRGQLTQLNKMAVKLGLGRAVAQRAKNKSPDGVVLPHELWPYRQKCLSAQVQEFLKKKLQPVLTADEKLALVNADANGIWPEYPLKLKELAENHDLRVPWQTLPGPPQLWDRYRVRPYFDTERDGVRAKGKSNSRG